MAEEKVSELRDEIIGIIVTNSIGGTDDFPAVSLAGIIGDLEGLLSERRTPTPVTEDWVMVPKAALDWLNGEATDPAGMEFGEFTEDYPKPAGAFWWRKVFRQICEFYAAQRPPLSASPSPPKADGPGEDGWQPIETAPKDGTRLLACWDINEPSYGVVWWEDGSWVEYDADNRVSDPTHWRPLPASPSIKREA